MQIGEIRSMHVDVTEEEAVLALNDNDNKCALCKAGFPPVFFHLLEPGDPV